MHLAGEWYYLCPLSVGARPPADFGAPAEATRKLEQVTTKPEAGPAHRLCEIGRRDTPVEQVTAS